MYRIYKTWIITEGPPSKADCAGKVERIKREDAAIAYRLTVKGKTLDVIKTKPTACLSNTWLCDMPGKQWTRHATRDEAITYATKYLLKG